HRPPSLAIHDPGRGKEDPREPSLRERRKRRGLILLAPEAVGEPEPVSGGTDRGTPRGLGGTRAREGSRDRERQDGRCEASHAGAGTGFSSGRSKRTRNPPLSRFSAEIVPPCSSTVFLSMARPSPVPPLLAEK